MANERSGNDNPTQETKPKKGKPVEIPVPSKRDVLRDLKKIAKPDMGEPDTRDG
ncbi:MAG TPA: hypothetical protein VMS74_04885 [Acidimicrobiia bacterium]|nr:hypothetical protein [Acidimicrobiia bacterium]